MKKITLLFVLFLFFIVNTYCQKRSLQVGIKILNELTFYNGFVPGFGSQLIYQKGKHSAIETGIFYEIAPVGFDIYVNNSYYGHGVINERRISIPVLYRFNSSILNFSVGPAMSYFIGWKTKSITPGSTINNFTDNTLQVIGSAAVSKKVNLSNTIILEPEIKFNNVIGRRNDGNFSLDFALRKEIF